MPELLLDGAAFTTARALASGLSRSQLRALVAAGAVRRILRGVFVDARVPDTLLARAAGLRLAVPGDAVFGGVTAAWLQGIDVLLPGGHQRPVPLEVVRPPGTASVRRPGVAARIRDLRPGETYEAAGLRVTTPARTVVDLARELERPHGLAYLDAALHRGLVTPGLLTETVGAMSGLPWVDQARELVALADARAESPGESWLRLRWHDAGLPPLELQLSVVAGGREVARLDTALLSHGLAVEYDGEEFHGPARAAADAARRRMLRRHGWVLLSVGKEAVLGRSHAFEAAVAARTGLVPRLVPWQYRARLPLHARRARERTEAADRAGAA